MEGKAAPETLVVVKDPRSPASQAELETQFNVSYKIFADSLEGRRALAETGSVKEQLANGIAKEIDGKPDLQKKVADLTASIDASLSGQTSPTRKLMGLDEANTALTAALHTSPKAPIARPQHKHSNSTRRRTGPPLRELKSGPG